MKVATYTFAGSNYTVWADRHKPEDGEVFYDVEEYADLCFYLSLNYYLSRDTIASEKWFRTGEAFWDGHGFLDKAARTDEDYQNYKLGLYLFTVKVTGFTSTIFNSVENRAWSYQKPENGGITALTYLNGTGHGTANVETTSAILLAYNEDLIEKLTSRLKVGAYYYTWWNISFNNHWEQGVKYTPFLGRYDSADNLTADKHILLAKQHKIDFFAISWAGKGDWVDWADTPDHTWDFDEIDRNLNSGLLAATHMQSFKFCLFYETILVLENANLHSKNFTDIFINDMIYAAQNYFNRSSYLRVDGKPVLFIYQLPYLYQNSPVSAEELLNTAKKKLEEMGGVYLVGDVGSGPSPENINLTWLYSMDAITSYHYHDSSRKWNEILGNASANYPRWQSFLNSNGKHFIPNVYPGFDNTEHCKWKNRSSEGSVLPLNEIMFKMMLTLAINYSDSNPNIMMITSWNEWLESTAIEPSVEFGELFLHTTYNVVPEFSSVNFLLLFLLGTTLAATVCRRKIRERFSKT